MPRLDVERGEDVARAATLVLELKQGGLGDAERPVSVRAAQRLHARLFVQAQYRRFRRRTYVQPADSRCFAVKIRVGGVEPVAHAVRLERHRAEKSAHGCAADLPPVTASNEVSERSNRPPGSRHIELRRQLHDQRCQLLPDMRLDLHGPTGPRSIAETVKTTVPVALEPAPNDLRIFRQGGGDLLDSFALVRQQHDAGSCNFPMLGASTPNERLKPTSWFTIEPNPVLRYPAMHPSFSCGFVERQLDSAGERTDPPAYFHPSHETIVTFETRH